MPDAPPAITIRAAADADADAVAALFVEAFPGLYGFTLWARGQDAVGALAAVLRAEPERLRACLLAEREGRVVGAAAMHPEAGAGRRRVRPADLAPALGAARAWRAWARWRVSQALFAGRKPRGVAYLDLLAVAEDARRQGAGALLLAACCERAAGAGHGELALHVLGSREEARRLYARHGFAAVPERRLGPRAAATILRAVNRMLPQRNQLRGAALMVRGLR